MSERLEPRLANELLARLGAGFDVKLSYAEVPSRLPGGYSSDLFRLRLDGVARELGGDLVLRLMHGDRDAAREICVHREVATTGFPAPTVHFAADSRAGLGRPFMLMDRVEGRSLLEESPRELRRLPGLLAEIMARLHALDPEPLGRALREAGWTDEALGAQGVLAEIGESISAAGAQGLTPGEHWLRVNRPARGRLVICHGDLHPGNLLMREGELVSVVDWEMAMLEEAEFDVARTVVILSSAPGGDGVRSWLRRRIGPLAARRFVSRYAQRAKLEAERLRWNEALHCLRLVALAAAAAAGSARQAPGVVALWAPLVDRLAERFRRLTGVAVTPARIEPGTP